MNLVPSDYSNSILLGENITAKNKIIVRLAFVHIIIVLKCSILLLGSNAIIVSIKINGGWSKTKARVTLRSRFLPKTWRSDRRRQCSTTLRTNCSSMIHLKMYQSRSYKLFVKVLPNKINPITPIPPTLSILIAHKRKIQCQFKAMNLLHKQISPYQLLSNAAATFML